MGKRDVGRRDVSPSQKQQKTQRGEDYQMTSSLAEVSWRVNEEERLRGKTKTPNEVAHIACSF